MKWKVIAVLQFLFCAAIGTHAQQNLITVEDILKLQRENRQHKNSLLLLPFKQQHKLKTPTLSKMPFFVPPPAAKAGTMPILRYIHPKLGRIPNGYKPERKQ